MVTLLLYSEHQMNKQLSQLDANQKLYETIQVMDISARQSRYKWGRFTCISGQELLLAKGFTYELAL